MQKVDTIPIERAEPPIFMDEWFPGKYSQKVVKPVLVKYK
jgi:hypothetical protein